MEDGVSIVVVDTSYLYRACKREGFGRLDYKKLRDMLSKRSGPLSSYWAVLYSGKSLQTDAFGKLLKRFGFKILSGTLDDKGYCSEIEFSEPFNAELDKANKLIVVGANPHYMEVIKKVKDRGVGVEAWFASYTDNDILKIANMSLVLDVSKLKFETEEKPL